MASDLSEKMAPKSFNIALALAADGLEEAASHSVVDYIDEEFEMKKKLIEDELKAIDEQYNADTNQEDLAKKILSAAHSIQELASNYGNDDVNLSPRIDRLKALQSNKDSPADFNISQFQQQSQHTNSPKEQKYSNYISTNVAKMKQDLAQYQISQINKSLKSKFENNEEINSDHGHVHPKKKIITLDEILRKEPSDELRTDNTKLEIDMIRTLRQNWIPPEAEIRVTKTKYEPGRLQIKNVYGNDKINDDVERLREERRKELKEIRRSYAEKKDHNDWNENESIKNAKPITKTVKLRSKSMHRSGNFDDFWVREASKEKDNAEKGRIKNELESVRLSRQIANSNDNQRLFSNSTINQNKLELHNLRSLRSNENATKIEDVKKQLERINDEPNQKHLNKNSELIITKISSNQEYTQLESVEKNKAGNGEEEFQANSLQDTDTSINLLEQPSQRGRDVTRRTKENRHLQTQRSKSLANFKTVLNKTSTTVKNFISRNK